MPTKLIVLVAVGDQPPRFQLEFRDFGIISKYQMLDLLCLPENKNIFKNYPLVI